MMLPIKTQKNKIQGPKRYQNYSPQPQEPKKLRNARAHLVQLAANLPITEGVPRMLRVLKKLGYKTAVLSGGFTFAANALKEQLGLDYAYANVLEVEDGKLTGRVKEPIVTPQRKADLLDAIAQREGIDLEQTIAVGDGANDMGMLERAGLGIAFHAKAKLKEAADTSVDKGGLDRILFLVGLRTRDIEDVLTTLAAMSYMTRQDKNTESCVYIIKNAARIKSMRSC